jgi:hypothetical protein
VEEHSDERYSEEELTVTKKILDEELSGEKNFDEELFD